MMHSKEKKSKYLFIVSSCVYPCSKPLSYSDVRSIYSGEERLEQTKNTIRSILEKCPDADIIVCDNGTRKPEGLEHVKLKYLGKNPLFRKAADSTNKSIGESLMLLSCWRNVIWGKYERIFKISGRYWLNDHFSLENYQHDAFCFLHLMTDVVGEHEYIVGTHSTRLYSFPAKCGKQFVISLAKALRPMLKGESVEMSWPPRIKYPLYYMPYLGVSGNVGVDKDWKDE